MHLRCGKRSATSPIKLLLNQHGDCTFAELLAKLKCKHCGRPPRPVHLGETHHITGCMGAPPGWAVELVPPGDSHEGCKPIAAGGD